jgi:drug/metabolite transporter (DMT)-like permease
MMLAAVSFAPRMSTEGTNGDPPPNAPPHTRFSAGVGYAVAAAIGFGFAFWWLGFHVGRDVGGAASVWVVRVTTLVAVLLVAAPARQSIRLPRGSVWWLLVSVGVTDTVAFVANNTGMQLGHVAVVTVLSSLYGAVTVLLSAIFVRDHIAKSQWLGIALIFAGIVLVNL